MVIVGDSLRFYVLKKLSIVHCKVSLESSICLRLVLDILLERLHLSLILVDVSISLSLSLVNDDFHCVGCVTHCCLQLDSDVVLLCESRVDLVILHRRLLDSVLELVGQVNT